jgi:hypothetical protein
MRRCVLLRSYVTGQGGSRTFHARVNGFSAAPHQDNRLNRCWEQPLGIAVDGEPGGTAEVEYRGAVCSASRSTARCSRCVFQAITQFVTSVRGPQVPISSSALGPRFAGSACVQICRCNVWTDSPRSSTRYTERRNSRRTSRYDASAERRSAILATMRRRCLVRIRIQPLRVNALHLLAILADVVSRTARNVKHFMASTLRSCHFPKRKSAFRACAQLPEHYVRRVASSVRCRTRC